MENCKNITAISAPNQVQLLKSYIISYHDFIIHLDEKSKEVRESCSYYQFPEEFSSKYSDFWETKFFNSKSNLKSTLSVYLILSTIQLKYF